jgi:hypothetical protein
VIDGILHRVRTGVQWRDLPERFGPWKTVYERHRLWSADGTWERLLQQIQAAADAAGEIDWDVAVDSTIVRAHQHAAGARTEPPPALTSKGAEPNEHLHHPGPGEVPGDETGDRLDRGGPSSADVHRHPVRSGRGQGTQGALRDVVDVDEVTNLVPAAVEMQRQPGRGAGREPGHHPRVAAGLDDLRLAVHGEVAHHTVGDAGRAQDQFGLDFAEGLGVGVHRQRPQPPLLPERGGICP